MKKILLSFTFTLFCFSSFAQVSSYVSRDSLKGWYPFSGNANNALGDGKNGTVVGGITLTTDRFGTANSAYLFNDSAGYVIVDTTFFNVGWPDYTISLWLNTDTLDNVFTNGNSQEILNTIPHHGIGITMNWNNSNKYMFFAAADPAMYSWNILNHDSSNANLTGTEHIWKHMVFMKYNDTNYSIYLDGILDRTFHKSTIAVPYYCKLVLGRICSPFPAEAFRGKLDDYGFWNRELANCEIRRLYNASPYSYITTQPANITTGIATTTHFTVTDTGTGHTYRWQLNTGTGFTNITAASPYSGVTTPTLTITPVTALMNSYKYRCVVSGPLVCVDTSAAATLTVIATGVNNVNRNSEISISPNPTISDLKIGGISSVDVKVYNAVGQLVKATCSQGALSLANLPAGLYMIRLYDEQGIMIYYDKIIKQ